MRDLDLLRKLESLQSAYIARATGDGGDTVHYDQYRRELLDSPTLALLLPDSVDRF